MRDQIVVGLHKNFNGDHNRMWLTTVTVAKWLNVTTGWVRALARHGDLPSELTDAGQRLFRRSDVWRCVLERTEARARSRAAKLAALRPRMIAAALEPRQLSLFSPRLRVVRRGERSLPHAEVKAARSFDNQRESESGGYVNRKAAAR